MKRIVITIIAVVGSFSASYAQKASDTAIRIYDNSEIRNTVQKRTEYARLTHGTFPGFRIQVNFGQDRNEANKIRNDFATKFPGIPTYMAYQQPYFKINVGDFRTKLEAVKNLNIVKKSYPGAFIVKDKINPPPLPQ
jgi:hypothetical protein